MAKFSSFRLDNITNMLVRYIKKNVNCRVWWNISQFERKCVCTSNHAAMNKSIETRKDMAPTQAAALDSDLCLLVDEKDNYIGSATKRECHKVGVNGKLLLHRAFSVLLFNTAGELLIQKRASQKVTYPNSFTNTCCSHPLLINGEPEDITTAAIRRLNVEMGIPENELKREDFTLLARFLYKDPGDGVWGEYELDYVLVLQSDVQVKPNPDEIAEIRYVPRRHIDKFMTNLEEPVTPWFKLMYRHMLLYWWDNLHRLNEIAEPQKIQSFI